MEPSEAGAQDRGIAAVRWARRALEASVAEGAGRDPLRALTAVEVPAPLRIARGVFVTLQTHPAGRLRGCIGFPLPVYPLGVAIARAAAAAALEDPRFSPVRAPELPKLTVEVSILTLPEPIEGPPEDRSAHVVIGRDGLIADAGARSGLLLPQVAPEQGWNAVEFLEGVCEKADLPLGAWRKSATQIRRFQAEVYREPSPGGIPVRSAESRDPAPS
jgi:uncharacterized protein (TIGR00296 family)